VGVIHALDVAAGTGVPVPVPGAANTVAGLEDPRRQSQPAHPVERVQSGEARPDDDGVERSRGFRTHRPPPCRLGRGVSRRAHGWITVAARLTTKASWRSKKSVTTSANASGRSAPIVGPAS